jgi:hypothetical protein
MSNPARLWDLDRFPDRLALWRDLENPPDNVLAVVEEWIPTRKLDPLRGARRQREEDNFWLAMIPGSVHDGNVVVCSFWVIRAEHLVRCDLFGTLALPA